MMSIDGVFCHFLTRELQWLVGSRINQINQPVYHDLELALYKDGEQRRLIISASGSRPRMHFIGQGRKNPLQAPNFCMYMRKHIQNAVIKSVEQVGLDRVIRIVLESRNEFGLSSEKTLIVELMGKYANIILVDAQQKVLDAIKRVTGEMSRVRQILPGKAYTSLEDDKINALTVSAPPSEVFQEENGKVFSLFYKYYTGLSPVLGRELCHRAHVDPQTDVSALTRTDRENLDQSWAAFRKDLSRPGKPQIVHTEGGKTIFHAVDLTYWGGEKEHFDSLSQMLETLFRASGERDRVHQKVAQYQKILERKLARDRKKEILLQEEWQEAKDRDQYKVYADLLSAHAHEVKPGQGEITMVNFYDPESKTVTLTLDPTKRVWDICKQYYKKYSKLKNAQQEIEKQLPALREEIRYVEQLLSALQTVTEEEEIEEIREELVSEGLIKKRTGKKQRLAASVPWHFETPDGGHIYVGKNNRQNDLLTMKTANREDVFCHIKDRAGAHVILRMPATEEDLHTACLLAAYFSQGAEDPAVSVDYTEKKNVRKAKGAKPGMVFYDHFTTVQVSPMDGREILKRLKKR